MAGATAYLDYSGSVLVQEAYGVSKATYGGIGYTDLRAMDFAEYEELLRAIIKDAENAE